MPEVYINALRKLYFLYESIGKVYEKLIQAVMAVTDSLAPSKNKDRRGTSQESYDKFKS